LVLAKPLALMMNCRTQRAFGPSVGIRDGVEVKAELIGNAHGTVQHLVAVIDRGVAAIVRRLASARRS
jgi:pheromone shutdown protein TraB